MLVPACVCTSSLLHYAETGTYYVLHILHGKDLTSETRSYFSSLFSKQKKLEIFIMKLLRTYHISLKSAASQKLRTIDCMHINIFMILKG